MVLTFKIDTSTRGLVWRNKDATHNGRYLELVGEANTDSAEEIVQSLEIRFLTQYGEMPFYPDVGFDYENILGYITEELGGVITSYEEYIRLKVLYCLEQEDRVVKPPSRLEVTRGDERSWFVFLAFKTKSGETVSFETTVGDFQNE